LQPTVYTLANTTTAWSSISDDLWHQVPFSTIQFTMANAGSALITWNLAVPMNGGFVTRLVIDNVMMGGTNMIIGNTLFVTSTGTYFAGPLTAAPHTVWLEYRTQRAFTFDPTADWQANRMQVMAYDH